MWPSVPWQREWCGVDSEARIVPHGAWLGESDGVGEEWVWLG